ncbi:MAG: hypothetical protein HFJ65_05425 [Eggerthellaceae bacterium]|nr:hypothetical protein [Eggerthellaceae bacterium]
MAATTSKRDWGAFFVGILVALAGIIVMVWPGLSLVMLAQIAGVGLLVAGVYDFFVWWKIRGTDGAGWTVLSGICDIILGIMFLVHPIVAAGVITLLVGCFVVVYGAFAIAAGFGLRKISGSMWGLMVANGILSLLCGVLFIIYPEFFAIYLGVFLLMRGVTMSVMGASSPNIME